MCFRAQSKEAEMQRELEDAPGAPAEGKIRVGVDSNCRWEIHRRKTQRNVLSVPIKMTQANSGGPTVERKDATEAAVKTSPPPLVASKPSVAETTNAPTHNEVVQRSNGLASSPPGAASESSPFPAR